MYKLITLSIALFSYTVAISQNVADTIITNPHDSIAKVIVADSIVTSLQKNTMHLPDKADPDFAAKIEEWKKNYPNEFNQLIKTTTDTNILKQLNEQAARDSKQEKTNTISTPDTTKYVLKNNPADLPQSNDKSIIPPPQPIINDSIKNIKVEATNVELPKDTVVTKDTVAKKAGEHAPNYDDPDYESKKVEWIKKYPNEYKTINPDYDSTQLNAIIENTTNTANNKQKTQDEIEADWVNTNDPMLIFIKQTDTARYNSIIKKYGLPKKHEVIVPQFVDTLKILPPPTTILIGDSLVNLVVDTNIKNLKKDSVILIKLSEHAPDPNDPDYAAKKEKWIKKYPDEYEKLTPPVDPQLPPPNNIINSDSNNAKKQRQLEELKKNKPEAYDIELKKIKKNDPAFYEEHLLWLLKNDKNRYKIELNKN